MFKPEVDEIFIKLWNNYFGQFFAKVTWPDDLEKAYTSLIQETDQQPIIGYAQHFITHYRAANYLSNFEISSVLDKWIFAATAFKTDYHQAFIENMKELGEKLKGPKEQIIPLFSNQAEEEGFLTTQDFFALAPSQHSQFLTSFNLFNTAANNPNQAEMDTESAEYEEKQRITRRHW